jgi:hypothetical protein
VGALLAIDQHWNWRLSAHCRALSLLTLWAFVFAVSAPALLVIPVFAVRTLASASQSVLNIRLGRREPLRRQTKLDWALIVAALVATEAVAAAHQYAGAPLSPLLLLPVVAPFSAVQFRIWRRSMQATPAPLHQAALLRLERFGSRARAA